MVTLGMVHIMPPLDDNPKHSERGCITYPEMRFLGHTSGLRSYALTANVENELGLDGVGNIVIALLQPSERHMEQTKTKPM